METHLTLPDNDNPRVSRGIPTALTTGQAATYTGLAAPTLEKLRCSGGGPPFIRYSRRAVRYRLADLDVWMAARLVGSTSQQIAA